MTKRKTTEEFIEEAKQVHGEKYDYSKVEYVGYDKEVCIICHEHGEFWQKPDHHLRGNGCPTCARLKNGKLHIYTTEDFIKEARKIHGDFYNYDKVIYKNWHQRVCIICPIHGEFWQSPSNHLQGKKCKKCAHLYSPTTEEFIEQAKQIHGDKFDYSKTVYINNTTKIEIICPIHGSFLQLPSYHLKALGCPKCLNRRNDTAIFIKKSKKIHGDKYDYSQVEYVNSTTPVKIVCPKHGEFLQAPANHLSGNGCAQCSVEKRAKQHKVTLDDFIKRANETHHNKYDYSNVHFSKLKDKVTIICPEHGEFQQEAFSHLSGCRCPECAKYCSYKEIEIRETLKHFVKNIKIGDRNLIAPYEIDMLFMDKKIGVEFDGIYWHTELFHEDKNYHLQKTVLAKKKGVSLIHIFEDEYDNKKDIVMSKILHALKKEKYKSKIYGRNCLIREIEYNKASDFLEKNHIQGKVASTLYLGAFHDNKLVGVMTFKKQRQTDTWDLNRFATDINYICPGVGGKLFSYFVKKYNPLEIKSFADRRWLVDENDNFYTKIGFTLDKILPPDYHYVPLSNGELRRIHKSNFRKDKLCKKYGFDKSLTENEMVKKLGYCKIWDCGLIRYVWKNKK